MSLRLQPFLTLVIVGAPTANTSQPGVIKGGAVYRCDIYDDYRCYLLPFDTKGNTYNDQNEQIDTKSNQWFGATVASAGIDGPLVACAPRYVFHQLQPRKAERVEPVGTCYLAKNNMQNFEDISPCRTAYWGYHRQGSCQAGFSAAITNDGSRLFIGAPGSYYWQGMYHTCPCRGSSYACLFLVPAGRNCVPQKLREKSRIRFFKREH
uniref:DUF4789 domain-containing protein n=1 Tax=Anopheles melas TaxID=34690 RepID=A0A182UGV3_9DIPT